MLKAQEMSRYIPVALSGDDAISAGVFPGIKRTVRARNRHINALRRMNHAHAEGHAQAGELIATG